MGSVFLLQHVNDLDGAEDVKLIGVYSSNALARAALARAAQLPGFVDHPDGFDISEYNVDVDQWTEGFLTVVNVEVPTRDSGVTYTAQASRLPTGYQLWADPDAPAQTWLFQPDQIVRCEVRVYPDGTERLVAVELVT